MKKTTVLIVDDHTLIRETWSRLLTLYNQYEIVGTTGDGQVAVDLAKDLRPDLVLLDINMTPLNGFDILQLIRKFSPASRVVAVSMHSQPVYAKKMLKQGARGYVTKNSTSDELIEALQAVVEGKIYVCKEVKEILSKQVFDDTYTEGYEMLTARELEIVSQLKKGMSSKEIASILFITPKTVEVHRHNILRKLNLKNAVALIQYANEHGF